MPRKKKEVGLNPFMQGEVIEVVRIVNPDRTEFNKSVQQRGGIYLHPFYNIDEVLHKKLSHKGRQIFLHLQYHLPFNRDIIKLRIQDLVGITGFNRLYVMQGLNELKEAGIIAPFSQSHYWVNPFYIFHGDKAKFYGLIDSSLIKVVSTHKVQ